MRDYGLTSGYVWSLGFIGPMHEEKIFGITPKIPLASFWSKGGFPL